MKALAKLLAASLLLTGGAKAAAQPATDATQAEAPVAASAIDDAVLALFLSSCMDGGSLPTDFDRVTWSDFPAALRFMNSYGHDGNFLRGTIANSPAFIARTRGPGHMDPGVETRCGIAVQGASYDRLVSVLATRLGVDPGPPLEVGGMTTAMLISRAGMVSVTRAADGWVILRNMGMMIAVPRR